ncbi:hypothetical protein M8818_002128 [Zalaria obscura]|uniref:Uncharacterized protein n=1 Tax=Zalaria obscura TaxID=2024903 RepID=A0ACC3SIJ7_9PEZI
MLCSSPRISPVAIVPRLLPPLVALLVDHPYSLFILLIPHFVHIRLPAVLLYSPSFRKQPSWVFPPPRTRHAYSSYSPLFVVDDPSDSSSHIDPHSTIDGLGDRTRSVSPEQGVNVWEIMQTTITPDPSLPSAESSFTGDAAAASASFNNDTDLRDGPPVTSAQRQRSESHANRDPDTNYYLAQDCLYDDEDTETETQMQTVHGQPESARASVADAMQRLRRAIAVRQRLQSTADFSNPRPERFGAEVQERSQDARRETHRFFRSNSLPASLRGENDSDEDDGDEEAQARPEGTEIGDTDLQAVFRLLENTDPEEAERDPEATDTLLRSLHRSLQGANERAEIALQEANATIARIEEGRRHIAAPDTDSLAGEVDELEQMRAIMERLERREQVPEEWWVAAGLDAAVGPQPEDAAEDGTIYATGRAPDEEGGRDWGILQVDNGRVVFRAP